MNNLNVMASILFQEKMESWLVSIKIALDKRSQKTNVSINTENLMKIFSLGTDLTKPFEYLLATGNLRSKTGKIKSIGFILVTFYLFSVDFCIAERGSL